jgi:hypothetical protein
MDWPIEFQLGLGLKLTDQHDIFSPVGGFIHVVLSIKSEAYPNRAPVLIYRYASTQVNISHLNTTLGRPLRSEGQSCVLANHAMCPSTSSHVASQIMPRGLDWSCHVGNRSS